MITRRLNAQRGSALLLVAILVLMLIGIAGAYLMVRTHYYFAMLRDQEAELSFVNAESAVDASLNELNAQIDYGEDGLGRVAGHLSDGGYDVVLIPPYEGPRRYVLRAVGTSGDGVRGVLAVVVPENYPPDKFGSAVFADLLVCLNLRASVDSYDSRAGDYFAKRTKQFLDKAYTNANADVRSNGAVEMAADSKVFGTVTTGPAFTSKLQTGAHVDGGTGVAATAEPLPPIEVPNLIGGGSLTIGASKTLTGSNHYDSLVLETGAKLVLRGPLTLVLDRFAAGAGAEIDIDGTLGPVTIYGTGMFLIDPTAKWESKTKRPSDFALRITTDTFEQPGSVAIATGGHFHGTIYAPNALLKLDTKMHLFGAVAAQAVELGKDVDLHYDESLAPVPTGTPRFKLLALEEFQAPKPPKKPKGTK